MFRLLIAVAAEVFSDHSNGARTSRVWIWIYLVLVAALTALTTWHWWSQGAIRAWAFGKHALLFAVAMPLLWIVFKMRYQRRHDLFPLMIVLLTLTVILIQFILPLEIDKP
jgi:hypothetical protein